ncbi:RNA-directed DNA polymerase, eukaryota, reverse transcriptase zinc-binding domain protein [Tanacetum coccineum]
MLAKWWWRFLLEENALWRKTIVSIHGTCGGLRMDSSSPYKSGPWFQIMRLKDDLSSYRVTLPSVFKRKVENGAFTRFWVDQWLGGPPLCATFPRLYRLETNKVCFVCDRAPKTSPNIIVPPGPTQTPSSQLDILHPPGLIFSWAWLRHLRSEAERQELRELVSLLSNLHLSSGNDFWECSISNDRVFLVKSMRSYISNLHYTANPQPYRWNKALPIKINISSWRIHNERLPTRSNLNRRGIDLHSTRCPVCDNDIETEAHLFITCEVAIDTWSKVLTWWKIQNITLTSLLEALNLADIVNLPSHNVSLFDAVVQSSFWFLWKFRNDMVFSLKRPSRDHILNDIKLASFNWVSSRVRKGRLN